MKIFPLLALLALAPLAVAQTGSDTANPNASPNSKKTPFTDKEDQRGFWQASLPGGSYLVALSKITSVSKHQYLLDGTLVVTEVTIDTLGDSLVRVYQITPAAENSNLATPARVVERGKEFLERVGQRTGSDLNNMVHKQYPTTTHSKTVEFRVRDLGTLDALHASVTKAWVSGRGRRFNVTE